jgi:peptide/nickel transport system substrate-binding protein
MEPSKSSARGLSRFSRSALFVVGPVMAVACSTYSLPRDSDPSPVTLRIGLPVQTGADPLYGANQAARLASLEGLTTQDINARAVPRLAEGWSQSSNGLAWTIRLRPTAVFHDGTPVDSKAVKDSLERFLRTREGRLNPGLQHIASIDSTSPYEVTIHLRERSNLLLEDLETPITKMDGKGALVGTGPYVVSSISGNEVEMTAFPKYYRGIGAVRRIVWRVYPTVRTAWAAALRGEVDFLYEVGPESREFVASEGSVTLYPFLRNYVYALVFNAERPIFKNPEIRRALNYAIDRNTVIEHAFRTHGLTASGPTWPLHWAYDSNAPTYPYDPERAIASIEKIPRTQHSKPRAQGLQFTCLIPENFQLWERLALIVQRDLAEIGVEMQLQSVPFEEFNQRVLVRRDFDVVLTEMVSGFSVSRPFAFWHSSGLHSFSGYRNPSVDGALKTINQATNDDDYRRGFQQLQQAMFDDPPAIFLGWGENARAVSRRFEVLKAPGGDIRMTISDWRLSGGSVRVAN